MVQAMQNLPVQQLAKAGFVPLLLIRHGQTASNKERRFVGRLDVPLNETGRSQAAALGQRLSGLRHQALYSSHLSRAVETARSLGEPVTIQDLQELNQGEWEGRPGHEVMAEFPEFFAQWVKDPATLRVPGGETLAECQARAVGALQDLLANHTPGDPVVVVSHQMVIHTVVLNALGLPLRQLRKLKQGNTAVNLLGWRDGDWVVRRLNDRDHLEDAQ